MYRRKSWRSTPRRLGLTEAALDCWELAASQAVARPAYKEAIAHCEAAIRLCVS